MPTILQYKSATQGTMIGVTVAGIKNVFIKTPIGITRRLSPLIALNN